MVFIKNHPMTPTFAWGGHFFMGTFFVFPHPVGIGEESNFLKGDVRLWLFHSAMKNFSEGQMRK